VARIEFSNPFSAPGRWWKGNLHTHTTVSDGELDPRDAAARYRALGYDFLAITDHGAITTPIESPGGLLIVPGAEYNTTAGEPVREWHFVSLGTRRPVASHKGPLDRMLAEVREVSEFWFLAHPRWSGLVEEDLLDVLPQGGAVEAFNGVCERAIGRGWSHPAWDYALASGRRLNALAVDDTHAATDVGRGWIMLRAARLGLDDLYEALHLGHWYSTNGPEIHDVRVSGDVVSVRTSAARFISFIGRSPDGKRFAAREGSFIDAAEYELKGRETYFRVQVEDHEGRRALTNPLYVAPEEDAP